MDAKIILQINQGREYKPSLENREIFDKFKAAKKNGSYKDTKFLMTVEQFKAELKTFYTLSRNSIPLPDSTFHHILQYYKTWYYDITPVKFKKKRGYHYNCPFCFQTFKNHRIRNGHLRQCKFRVKINTPLNQLKDIKIITNQLKQDLKNVEVLKPTIEISKTQIKPKGNRKKIHTDTPGQQKLF
jgi:hypothetical protein